MRIRGGRVVAPVLLCLWLIACSGPGRATPTPSPTRARTTTPPPTLEATAIATLPPTATALPTLTPTLAPDLAEVGARWATTGALTTARAGQTATLLSDGRVLVAGGETNQGGADRSLASAELYDPATETWNLVASMNLARWGHTATLLPNGQVLVVGGETSQNGSAHTLASAEIYDPGTNRWRMVAPPALGRSHHTATLLPNGQVLVVGGDTTDAAGTDAITPTAELYDSASNSWTPVGALAVPRGDHTATMLPNGQVLITGGETQAGGGDTALTSSAEVFDAASRTWTATGTLTTGRAHHTATLLPDGRVLVVGGETPDSRGDRVIFIAAGAARHLAMAASSSAEIYDPATRTWTPVASLTTPRFAQTATLLTDGSVLVVGGSATADGQPVATAERYNPVANQWSALPMSGARVGHTATLLRDGSLLIAGGLSAPNVYLATAERFVSRTMRPVTPTPTATPVPTPAPTLTPVPTPQPTMTPVPPTATATVPPTPTKPLLPPTVVLPTPAPSATPVPPTKPPPPPTNTPRPPTATPAPPTATPVPPTATPKPPPAPTSTPSPVPAPPGTVFGVVRYCTADGCAGAPGAVVVADGLTATADRAGNYVLVNVPSGQVAVTASYRDRSAQQTVAVPASGRVQADFALK